MPKLPRVSGRETVRAFQRAGWEVTRQRGIYRAVVNWQPDLTFSPICSIV